MCFCLRVKMQIKSLRPNQRADLLLRSHLQKAATLWRVSTADRAPPVRPCMEQTRIIKKTKEEKQERSPGEPNSVFLFVIFVFQESTSAIRIGLERGST